MTDEQDRIVCNPRILAGKPVIRGTRISVEFILEVMAAGWSVADILDRDPGITEGDVVACLNYAREAVETIRAPAARVRILADENFPGAAVKVLIGAGHEAIWIRTNAPQMADDEIFDWAIREDRVILTFDKDFGEIASKTPATNRCGVILFRKPLPPIFEVGDFAVRTLASQTDWNGYLSVVEGSRIRHRPVIIGD